MVRGRAGAVLPGHGLDSGQRLPVSVLGRPCGCSSVTAGARLRRVLAPSRRFSLFCFWPVPPCPCERSQGLDNSLEFLEQWDRSFFPKDLIKLSPWLHYASVKDF